MGKIKLLNQGDGVRRVSGTVSRRRFLGQALAVGGGLYILGLEKSVAAGKENKSGKMKLIGKVMPRSGKEITSSSLGVGFETLDRKLFLPEKTYDALASLGVKWARVQTGWCRCETVKGTYEFGWLDEIVDSLLAIGIQPWFNVGYGNQLYTPEAPEKTAVGWIPENSDEARRGWISFVRALADHYQGRVTHYEIWNEPNVMPFWRPGKPTPEGYTAFIKRTSEVIRSQIPGSVIIGGGFGGFPTNFLKESLELKLADYIDKITYHPYVEIPEKNYQQQVTSWRELLAQYKPSLVLWQGECGCPSTDYSVGALSKLKWNESRQARWLLRRTINDLRLNLEMISWYHASDQAGYRLVGYPEGKSGAYFGLLRMDDYSRKPSYYAYQTMCALFDSQTQVCSAASMKFTPPVQNAGSVEQAAFQRGASPICAYWLPASVMEDTPEQTTGVTVSLQQNLNLQKPVLIDPLTGNVYKLKGKQENGQWLFSSLPLRDYPMLITDSRAFKLA